jgi:virginiamycin B lyase
MHTCLRVRICTCLLSVAPALVALPIANAPLAIVEYQLPRPNAFPHDPAVARDGSVWYTDQVNSYIGHLDPTTRRVTDYATPTPKSGPHGIVIAPDGMVWYTANRVGKIGELDPATGHIREFVLPNEARDPHTPLVLGGDVWFTVQQSNMYGRLDPRTGDVKTWHVNVPRALPYGMVKAPDGSIWIALFGTNRLVHRLPARQAGLVRSTDARDPRMVVTRERARGAIRHRDRPGRSYLL